MDAAVAAASPAAAAAAFLTFFLFFFFNLASSSSWCQESSWSWTLAISALNLAMVSLMASVIKFEFGAVGFLR